MIIFSNSTIIRLKFDPCFRIFGDLIAELLIANFEFAVRAKSELLALVQSTLQNYKRRVICKFTRLQTSAQFDHETVPKRSFNDSREIYF